MTPERQLDAALAATRAATRFWWRDDDAGRDHPRLAALLSLSASRAAPLSLAVVPDWLDVPCVARIRAAATCTVLQHGIAHADHAAPPAKKIELGGTADRERLRRDLGTGRERLAESFGNHFLPLLVPPWNRIAPDLVPALPELGYSALSVYGRRAVAEPVPGLRQLNTHLDLIDWRDGSQPLTLSVAVERLVALIRSDLDEPIGILSHHLVMDDAAFATLDRLLALVLDHPQAELASAGTLLREGR